MAAPIAPLKFPSHFPPTDRWNKFFIGVRWLGPDLSFFKDLESQQASRKTSQMNAWGGGTRQEIAEIISNVLYESLGWNSNVFLPQDQFSAIAYGPKFDTLNDFVLKEAVEELEHRFNIKISSGFWIGLENATFGEVVDKFVRTQSDA